MPNKSLTRLIRIVTGTFGSGREDLFSLEASLTRFEKFVHFWVLVWQSFVRNRCPVRASALSYTTLLALIPMLAVAMSVSSVFLKTKGEEQIETSFIQNVRGKHGARRTASRCAMARRTPAAVRPSPDRRRVVESSATELVAGITASKRRPIRVRRGGGHE